MNILNRKGFFKISRSTIDKHPEAVMMVMARCVVVRAESLFIYDVVEYHAYSPEFNVVQEGALAPEYRIVTTEDEAGSISIMFIPVE